MERKGLLNHSPHDLGFLCLESGWFSTSSRVRESRTGFKVQLVLRQEARAESAYLLSPVSLIQVLKLVRFANRTVLIYFHPKDRCFFFFLVVVVCLLF